MNNKAAKKLRKLAGILAMGKPPEEKRKIYDRLKTVHKQMKSKK